MPINLIASKYRVPFGPFDLFPTIQVNYTPRVRLTQQYIEVIDDGTNNKVRLTQQYVEVIDSGTNNKVRLTQQYIEVVRSFGDPPPKPGGGGGGSGKNKWLVKDNTWRIKRQQQWLPPASTITTGNPPSSDQPTRPMIIHCGRLMGWP